MPSSDAAACSLRRDDPHLCGYVDLMTNTPLEPLDGDDQDRDDQDVEERYPDEVREDKGYPETPNPDPEDPDPVVPPPRTNG